VIIEIAGDLV